MPLKTFGVSFLNFRLKYFLTDSLSLNPNLTENLKTYAKFHRIDSFFKSDYLKKKCFKHFFGSLEIQSF